MPWSQRPSTIRAASEMGLTVKQYGEFVTGKTVNPLNRPDDLVPSGKLSPLSCLFRAQTNLTQTSPSASHSPAKTSHTVPSPTGSKSTRRRTVPSSSPFPAVTPPVSHGPSTQNSAASSARSFRTVSSSWAPSSARTFWGGAKGRIRRLRSRRCRGGGRRGRRAGAGSWEPGREDQR